jgi:hypothetical protein
MGAITFQGGFGGNTARLRAYLVRHRRSESKRWSQQHQDAWALLNALNNLLSLLQSLDQQAEGNNLFITMALREHGRDTVQDQNRRAPKMPQLLIDSLPPQSNKE